MKKRLSIVMLFTMVAAQLGWLGYNYYAREVELAAAPSLLVPCDAFDPRDLFRGDYVSFECEFVYPLTDPLFNELLHWPELTARYDLPEGCTAKPIPARAAAGADSIEISNRASDGWSWRPDEKLVGYWVTGADGKGQLVRVVKLGSAGDVLRPGEVRSHLMAGIRLRAVGEGADYQTEGKVELSLLASEGSSRYRRNFRFYVPENMGDARRTWHAGYGKGREFPLKRMRTTVEFACREHSGLVVRNLYINDIPWVEAMQMMQAGSFPLLPEPTADGQN